MTDKTAAADGLEVVALPAPDVISEKTDEPYAYKPETVRSLLASAQAAVAAQAKQVSLVTNYSVMLTHRITALEAALKAIKHRALVDPPHNMTWADVAAIASNAIDSVGVTK